MFYLAIQFFKVSLSKAREVAFRTRQIRISALNISLTVYMSRYLSISCTYCFDHLLCLNRAKTGYIKCGKIDDFKDWLRCAHLAIDENLFKTARMGIYNAENRRNWLLVSLYITSHNRAIVACVSRFALVTQTDCPIIII